MLMVYEFEQSQAACASVGGSNFLYCGNYGRDGGADGPGWYKGVRGEF